MGLALVMFQIAIGLTILTIKAKVNILQVLNLTMIVSHMLETHAQVRHQFALLLKAFCELPNNQCNHQRLHKCQTCGHWGCKSRNHSQQKRPPGRPQAHVATCDHENFNGPISPAPHPSVEPNSDSDK